MAPLFTSFDDAWSWFMAGGELTSMADWRQGFTRGRAQLLAFQIPLAETAIADAVQALQDELQNIDGLVMFEQEMLHVSVRGAGFQVLAKTRPDDVSREDVSRIAQRAARILSPTPVIELEVGPPGVFPNVIM